MVKNLLKICLRVTSIQTYVTYVQLRIFAPSLSSNLLRDIDIYKVQQLC